MELHGAPTALEQLAVVNRMGSAIADSYAGKVNEAKRHTRSVILALYAGSPNLSSTADPWFWMLHQRVSDARRACIKKTHLVEKITEIMHFYYKQAKPGSKFHNLEGAIPMPRGRALRGAGIWKPRPPGPIAFLFQSAAVHTAATDTNFNLHCTYTQQFNIIHAPANFVRRAVYMVSGGAAFHAIAFNRETFSGQRIGDRTATVKFINTVPQVPLGEHEIAQRTTNRWRERAEQRSKLHRGSLGAPGLPVDYVHNDLHGKQYSKAALQRNCLADNLWGLVRAYTSGQ